MHLHNKTVDKQHQELSPDIEELLSRPDSDVRELMEHAAGLRDQGHGRVVSYSPKVFIPLTKLCRDVCHYCTFAQPPRAGQRAYLSAGRGAGHCPRRRRRGLP